MTVLKDILSVIVGFGSGVVISGAVFAFITIIGLVPRLAQKTSSTRYVQVYEMAIVIGGILGAVGGTFKPSLPWLVWLLPIVGLAAGIFYGCMAMSLAEVLDVIPILARRMRIQRGMFYLIMAIALGKMTGSLLYFLVPGFYKPH